MDSVQQIYATNQTPVSQTFRASLVNFHLKFVIIKRDLQWQCHLVYEICAHATELSNHNHKAKGPVSMEDAPVLPTSSVVADR